MLPASIGRVVTTAPHSPVFSSFISSNALRFASFALSCRHPQRRYSSSKPSRAGDNAKDISTRQSDRQPSTSSKPAAEKRKRKAKDENTAARQTVQPLPFVPSTKLSPEALGLSTFFSLHRPICVENTFPLTVTDEHFADIFAIHEPEPQKMPDVISTLSQTVGRLDTLSHTATNELHQSMAQLGFDNGNGQDQAEPTRINLRHADGSETSVYVALNTMSGSFLPFRPPPPPQPQTAAEAEASTQGQLAMVERPSEEPTPSRTYKAILTIEESVGADGQYKVTAHSPTLVDEGTLPRTFLERMALRQAQWEESRRRRASADANTMLAISVRRQRKLKMKKKKYKKLQRRDRLERRKLQRG